MKSGYCEKWDTYYDDAGKWTEPECECDPDECEYTPRPETHPPFCPDCPSAKGRTDGLRAALTTSWLAGLQGDNPDE